MLEVVDYAMKEKKMLVVDDEKSIRKLLRKNFEEKGYVVLSAENAEEAIGILKDERIQVMFLDLNLPGISGVELCKEIRKHDLETAIYAITGLSSLFEVEDCLNSGFDDYFEKPLDLELLLKAAEDGFRKIKKNRR